MFKNWYFKEGRNEVGYNCQIWPWGWWLLGRFSLRLRSENLVQQYHEFSEATLSREPVSHVVSSQVTWSRCQYRKLIHNPWAISFSSPPPFSISLPPYFYPWVRFLRGRKYLTSQKLGWETSAVKAGLYKSCVLEMYIRSSWGGSFLKKTFKFDFLCVWPFCKYFGVFHFFESRQKSVGFFSPKHYKTVYLH